MSELTLLPITDYVKIAERLISSSNHPWMLEDEYIGIVVHHLIISDMSYDSTKGASIKTYRYKGWLNAKKRIIEIRIKRGKTVSLHDINHLVDSEFDIADGRVKAPEDNLIANEDEEFHDKTIKDLINHESLNPKEKLYLKLIYVDGKKQLEIAEMFKVTKQAVSFTERKAIRKLKELYGQSLIDVE